MAALKESTAAGLQVNRPAATAKDVVRLAEYQTDIAARPTASEVAASVESAVHDPVTTQDSQSVAFGLTGQQITANVSLKTDGALQVDAGGVSVNLGTAATQAAAGDHAHTNDHPVTTGLDTESASVTVESDQVISVNVTLDPSGNLVAGASGIGVLSTAFAAASHVHSNATQSVAGFMSAADKIALDTLDAAVTPSFAESPSIYVGEYEGTYSANIKAGSGLTIDRYGVTADFSIVSQVGHTHTDVTETTAGFISSAMLAKLNTRTGYITLDRPSRYDGTGCVLQTASSAVTYFNQGKFSSSAAESGNWLEYIVTVPEDLDTSVDLEVARWKFQLSGADTGKHRYIISVAGIDDSESCAAAPGAPVNLDFAGDASGASGDMESVSGITLNGWKSVLNPGQLMVVRVARAGDNLNDTSAVDSYSGVLVISYGATQ